MWGLCRCDDLVVAVLVEVLGIPLQVRELGDAAHDAEVNLVDVDELILASVGRGPCSSPVQEYRHDKALVDNGFATGGQLGG